MSTPDPNALAQESRAAIDRKDWAAAVALLKRRLEIHPSDAGTWHDLGFVAFHTGALTEAEQYLQKAGSLGAGLPTMLLLARIFTATGRDQEAFRCYKAILQIDPVQFDALMAVGGVRERTGDYAAARECYRQAVAAQPANTEAVVKYANFIFDQNPDAAVDLMTGLLPGTGADLRGRGRVLEVLIGMREWQERIRRGQMHYHAANVDELFFTHARDLVADLETTATALLASNPADAAGKLWLGFARLSQGDRAAAHALFESARNQMPGHTLNAANFLPAFHEALRQTSDQDLVKGLPPVTMVKPPVSRSSGVLYLSCDVAYFSSFGLPMLCSLRDKSPDTPVHLHIMEASAGDIARIVAFCDRLAPFRYALSVENPNLTAASRPRWYFHSVRFIRFYEALGLYKCPLWMTDVDTIVNRDLGEMFARLETNKLEVCDVAMRVRPGRLEPQNQFSACAVGASQSEASRAYFRQVAAYIAYFYRNGGLRWGIDQLAMYSVFADLKDLGRAPRPALLGNREVDFDFREDGFLWMTAGAQKFFHLRRAAENSAPSPTENRLAAALEVYWRKARVIAAEVGWPI